MVKVRREAIRRHATRSHEAHELLRRVEDIGGQAAAQVLRDVLRGMVGARIYVSRQVFVLDDHRRLAERLVAQQMSRPDARDALMQRLRIGKSKAYALIDRALQARAPTFSTADDKD